MGPLQDRHLSALNNSDMSSKLDEGRDDGNCICVVSDDEGQLPHNRIRMGEGGGNPRRRGNKPYTYKFMWRSARKASRAIAARLKLTISTYQGTTTPHLSHPLTVSKSTACNSSCMLRSNHAA